MAIILKGKHKGKDVRIRQFCNDWFHIEHEEISHQESIKNPASLGFTKDERNRIELAYYSGKTGTLFSFYKWHPSEDRLIKK